jgi:hypothetical protein
MGFLETLSVQKRRENGNGYLVLLSVDFYVGHLT